jgi:hypothetical protein
MHGALMLCLCPPIIALTERSSILKPTMALISFGKESSQVKFDLVPLLVGWQAHLLAKILCVFYFRALSSLVVLTYLASKVFLNFSLSLV